MSDVDERPFRVLIPTAGAVAADHLIDLAGAVVEYHRGEGSILSVVEVPQDHSLSEGALVVRRRRNVLRKLAQVHSAVELRATVRTAHSLEAGIREAVLETGADLLFVDWKSGKRPGRTLQDLVDNPPCDLAVAKLGNRAPIRRVLLPVRGGPHAQLALRVAQAIAERHEAVLTLLHVVLRHWSSARRIQEDRYCELIRREATYIRTEHVQVESDSVDQVLLAQGAEHDLVVMGAAARDDTSPFLLGRLPAAMARRLPGTLIAVKTREPVTGGTFGLASAAGGREPDLSRVVDRWFAENTFHSHEFRSIPYLLDLKQRQRRTISLAVPTLNEEKTVGKIISTIKRELVDRHPLIDEFIVVDSESQDRTVEIVTSLGVPVFQHPRILPEHGVFRGKGEALWKSLQVTSGDIVVWIDSDITGIHPKFVYGLIGPLLTQPQLGFVKGFYRRPLNLDGQRLTTGGGRVTELTARPLFNLFYPELSGLVQPLAGEMAGRRDVLESVPFFTGYGVETGLLIDILEQFGLRCIAQTDLEERVHRNQSLLSLSKMAFAIVQVVMQRLGERRRVQMLEEMNTSMKLIHYSPTELFLEVKEIEENERPPIKSLREYAGRSASLARELVEAGAVSNADQAQ